MTLNKNISVWRGEISPPTIFHIWERYDLENNYLGTFTYQNGEWVSSTESFVEELTIPQIEQIPIAGINIALNIGNSGISDSDTIIVGTQNGGGRLDLVTNTIQILTSDIGNCISLYYDDITDSIYFGGQNGIYVIRISGEIFKINGVTEQITNIFKGSNNSIYAVAEGICIYKIDAYVSTLVSTSNLEVVYIGKTEQGEDLISTLTTDSTSGIWVLQNDTLIKQELSIENAHYTYIINNKIFSKYNKPVIECFYISAGNYSFSESALSGSFETAYYNGNYYFGGQDGIFSEISKISNIPSNLILYTPTFSELYIFGSDGIYISDSEFNTINKINSTSVDPNSVIYMNDTQPFVIDNTQIYKLIEEIYGRREGKWVGLGEHFAKLSHIDGGEY